MHVKLTKTGRVVYNVDEALGILLTEGDPEHYQQYIPPAKPAPIPQWSLWTTAYEQKVAGLHIRVGREDIIVRGSAEMILDNAKAAIAGRNIPLPPDALIAAYAQATGMPLDPEAVREQRERRRQADEARFREQNKLGIPELARQS